MVWNLQEVAVKPFTHFYIEILMVFETSGRCCESIINSLESRGGCCEAIYTLLTRNLDGFEFPGGCCEAICSLLGGNINILMKI